MYVPQNPYVALVEVVEELKKDFDETLADLPLTDELLRAIERASRWVDEYTQRDYFFRDFTATPMQFDQFSKGVYGDDIFFPTKPIINIEEIWIGADVDTATQLNFNADYFFDVNRIYLLPSSRMFVFNAEIPRDRRNDCSSRGWNLYRPGRILFVYGKSGYPQAFAYAMTASGGAASQTDAWTIKAYSAPTALYWKIENIDGTTTVTVTSDSFGANVVCRGSTTTSGAQVLTLAEVNASGVNGQVSINYSADGTGNTLAITPSTTPVLDSSSIPRGIDSKITTATRLVAAAFSGHNRKEVVGLDGQKSDIADTAIPKTVFDLLGRRMPILV